VGRSGGGKRSSGLKASALALQTSSQVPLSAGEVAALP